jgi:signal transduction histidine kinase
MIEETVSLLIVDDEPRSLVALEALLADESTRVVTARSGQEALRKLLEEDFAVVLLDVQMPGLDGFETAEIVRQRDRNRATPILFLTAWGKNDSEVLRGYRVGAVDYVFKPVVPEVLRGKVGVFIELHRKSRALQRQNAELEAARARAERESAFKSKFLASMSHELRTPLHAIIGFSELLEKGLAGPLQPKQQEYVQHVLSSGRHLRHLVDDVLDLSKVEAGRLALVREPVPLGRVAGEVHDEMRAVAQSRGVALHVTVAPDLPPVEGDPVRLRQILFNLVSNAIKFTPPNGHVHVTVLPDERGVRLDVEDDGVGIRPENLSRLFREFEQIEADDGRRPEGTGLGLALTHRLVEAHGGTIEVQSTYGKGSRFTVRLPVQTAQLAQ